MKNFPKIVAFHDDKKIRVVWWYGPVFINNSASNIPQVLVLTKLFDENSILTEQIQVFKINITELELVRIGTIWKGQERLDGLYTTLDNYRNSQEFLFDFTALEPKSVPFNSKIEESKWLIPPFRYNLGNFKDYYVSKKQFYNSTLAKLVSTNGITILIPSLELLTSAIAPEHKLLRAHLLQKPIDQICADYMHRGYEKDGTYIIESKNSYFRSNLTLLVYMRNNPTSRSRLSKTWSSIQVNHTKYPEKYPIILPYHPTELTLLGDGIQIDDKTFLMLRINGFSLPTDYPVHNIMDEPVSDPLQSVPNISERNIPRPQNPRKKDNLPITGDKDPHHNAGEVYIRTEVRIIGPEAKIELFKKQKINNEPPKIIPLEKQEIEALSSGEQNSRNDSRGTASAKQAPIKIGDDISNIEWAIKELNELISDPNSGIRHFVYIDNDGTENIKQIFCYLSESSLPAGHKRKWYINNKSLKKNDEKSDKTGQRYRKFLIAKIILKNGKKIYLLEIEQKGTEAFSGLLLNASNNMSQESIKDLLLAITKYEGRFRKRENGKLVPTDVLVEKSFVFEHRKSTKLSKIIKDFFS